MMKLTVLIATAVLAGCAYSPTSRPPSTDKNRLDPDTYIEQLKRYRENCKPENGCAPVPYSPEEQVASDRIIAELKQSSVQRQKDLDVCHYEAVKATASGPRGYTVYSTIFNDVMDTGKQSELIQLCMKSKGY